ncbi:MAG: hypothetical protein C4530_01695 [Desulfobacteraceae bacterium]|nr:MAG: hypothetical protein C4530_01695 [Desulfobacteraceae bacterium]
MVTNIYSGFLENGGFQKFRASSAICSGDIKVAVSPSMTSKPVWVAEWCIVEQAYGRESESRQDS